MRVEPLDVPPEVATMTGGNARDDAGMTVTQR